MIVHLLIQLLAGQHNFIRIEDDHIVAGVNMRGIDRLVLSAQDRGNLAGQTAQHNAFRVHDVPLALHVRGFGHVGIQGNFLLRSV